MKLHNYVVKLELNHLDIISRNVVKLELNHPNIMTLLVLLNVFDREDRDEKHLINLIYFI
jgi:hypothetical protein